jgi:hypothetical protein
MAETDAGRLLWRGLQAAQDWENAPAGSAEERAAAETATSALLGLHTALSQGARLPEPWIKARPPSVGGYSSGAMIS